MRKKKILMMLALLLTLTTQAWAAEGITCTASDVGRVVCTDGSIYDNVSAAEADGKTAVAMIAYHDTVNKKALALALADESMMQWSTAISTCSAKTPTVTGGTWKLATKDEWNLMITAAGSDTALRNGFSSVGGTNMQSGQYWSSTEKDSGHAWLYDFRDSHWYFIEVATANDKYVRACLAFDFTALTYPVKMADNWNVVYWRTQTKQSDWTALSAGSTTGRTLGSADAMTYYYATGDLSFTNSTAGGSGLTILGTVYLYVPEGKTVTCTGANASGLTGGGAGIELTEGNSLYLIGGGTLNANGGNAANGGNGGKGNDAEVTYNESILGGSGGTGGNGGGGAGAGIGTRGGNGGTGGSGGQRNGSYGQETTQYGVDGSAGTAGSTAGAMGTLYGYQALAPTVNVNGGNAGSNGTGGSRGKTASQHPGSNVYMASGGGGGGAGGFGGAASNIGTGGPGGGGGGGGAAGNVAWVVYTGTANGYYHAGAYGGDGGKNADGSSAPDGADVELDNPKHADIEGGGLRDKDTDYDDDDGWEDGNGRHDGGAGGAAGSSSVGGSYGTVTLDWTTQGKGTEDDPFIVSSTDDWNEFADYVNNGISLSGKFVKLTADIDISTMAGASDANSFQGTFDGDGHTLTFTKGTSAEPFAEEYCAPFRHVKNAVIKNLHVDGTIYTNQKKAAGFVGESHGALTITNCRSSVNIHSSKSGDGTHGGFVATLSGANNVITIDGCVFDGSFATTNGTTNCGGFIGWVTYNKPTITNSLMAPASVGAGMVANTFSRWHTGYEPTITNCYYVATTNLPTDQGTEAIALDTAPANLGSLVEDYGMVKAYQNGILVGGLYYVDRTMASFRLLSDATTGDVGKVVCAAGHLHPAKTVVPDGCTAVGILGKVTETGRGLILALQNAPEQTWLDINGWASVTAYAGTTLKQLPNDATRGSLTSYTTLGKTTVSNWCVAQKSDYEAIFINLGSTTGDSAGKTYDANVNAYITGVGGMAIDGKYCSASVTNSNLCWCFESRYWFEGAKLYSRGIRPVLGFTFIASELPGTGTAGDPYTISNSDEWTNFAYNVNSGNNFSGKYVKLTSDISVTTPVGYRVSDSDNKPFSGTFLGDGHTITVTLDDDGNQGLAPFRYINGATIKDLKVAGAIASSQYHTSGLVGFAKGTNTIEDCLVTATLNITSNYAGGIIGHGLNSNTTIRGCAFTGTINGVDVERENIGGIWGWSSSGTPTLLNCLENGTYTNIASMHPMGLQNGSGTITNCYYMNPQVGSPQNACTVSGAKQAYTAATAPANLGDLVQNYGIVKAYANGILVGGTYYVAPATVTLADNADNSTAISGADGYVANVTLAARTLYKDGDWNTLCLPFGVDDGDNTDDKTFTGTPLEGAIVKELDTDAQEGGVYKTRLDGSMLYLHFKAVTRIEAGKPYIIKWETTGEPIVNPVFTNVYISSTTPIDVTSKDGKVTFTGQYDPFAITDGVGGNIDKILLLAAGNKIGYSQNARTLHPFRCHFYVPTGTAGARAVNDYVLDFDDEETTRIISTTDYTDSTDSDKWYTLNGLRLDKKPTQKGIYIHNGRKMVIK